jgi:hypothetical protein
MRLWERNDAPPHVEHAPGAGAHPYLVLCHRPPEDAAAAAASDREDAPSYLFDDEADHADSTDEGLDLDGGGQHSTATVYQWVRVPR